MNRAIMFLVAAAGCASVVHPDVPDSLAPPDPNPASDLTKPDDPTDAATFDDASLPPEPDPEPGPEPVPDVAEDPATDSLDIPVIDPGQETPAPTQQAFSQIVSSQDGAGLEDFLAGYDMPICESGKCLFVTRQKSAKTVKILGDFDWKNGVDATPLPFAPDVFHATVDLDVTDVLEYKLQVDGQWAVDRTNRYFRFGPFGINSAIYAAGRSRLALVGPVHSPQLGNDRMLYVYLPAAYHGSPQARFPVLYMQDGFNVFTNPQAPFGHWGVDASLDALIPQGLVEPLIVVGIDTADRVSEYLYNDITLDMGNGPQKVVPKLDLYGAFLDQTVKPLIDATFRTRPGRESTAIAGSSFGGISSLYLAWTHNQTFSRVASLSGSFWVGERGLDAWIGEAEGEDGSKPAMREIIAGNAGGVKPEHLKIYLDCGDTEGGKTSYPADSWVTTDWTRNALIRQGWNNRKEWDTDADLTTAPEDLPPSTPVGNVPHLVWAASPPAPFASWAEYLGVTGNLVCLVGHGHEHNEAAWTLRFRAALIFLFPGSAVKPG